MARYVISALSLNAVSSVEPTPYQRDLSPAHVKRLLEEPLRLLV